MPPLLDDPQKQALKDLLQTTTVTLPGLFRLSGFATTEPYWAVRAKYRFDAPFDPSGAPAPFGVLYAGSSLETAFCESVLHESNAHNGAAYQISMADLTRRDLVQFRRPGNPDLLLADLTGAPLKKLGLSNDVSATNDYQYTQEIASWIWQQHPDIDGIQFVSRQLNTTYCYALFDRSSVIVESIQTLSPTQLDALCVKFGVDVLAPPP